MLLDRDRELLTAYVDGELSARQQRHVLRLLRRSPEARKLLKQMQDDARKLRHLARTHLDRDLSETVVEAIVTGHLAHNRRLQASAPRPIPSWVGLAAAAAVLFVIGVSSYLYFAASLDHQPDTDGLTQRDKKPAPDKPNEKGPEVLPAPIVQVPKDKGAQPGETPKPPPGPIVDKPKDSPKGQGGEPPIKPPNDELIITAPSMEMFELKTADVAPLFILKLREIDQEAARQKLVGELQKDSGFRLELPCKDGTRAFERLQAVLKANQVNLLIDQVAQGRLKKPNWKTNYVLFAEGLTPEEWARILQQLAAEDKKAETRKPSDPQFDRVVLTHMTKHDHKELSDLLGVDAAQLQTKPEAEKPGAKPTEQTALALAYNPVRPHPGSTEVKRFLEGRKPVRAGTVQVLVVLRNVGG
jgi:hypothetical protein